MIDLDLGSLTLFGAVVISLAIVKSTIHTLCKTMDKAIAELAMNTRMVMGYKASIDCGPHAGIAMVKEVQKPLEPRLIGLDEPKPETGIRVKMGL